MESLILTALKGMTGNYMILSIFGMLFLLVLGVAVRLSFEGFVVCMLAGAVLFATYALPTSIIYGLGIIAGMFLFYVIIRLMR